MSIALVVATYGRDRELVDALSSVLPQLRDGDEVLIVDQSESHDAPTTTFLRGLGAAWHRVSPPSLPAARNYGLAHTTADVIVFIDDDVLVDPSFLEAHREAHERYPQAAAVAGRVRLGDQAADTAPFRMTWLGRNLNGFNYEHQAWVPSVQGCNMSWKRTALNDVGNFDTRFIGNAFREESELSARARQHGWTVRYWPTAALEHLVAQTGGCRVKDVFDDATLYRNDFLFQRLTMPRWMFPLLTARVYRSAVLRPTVWREKKIGLRLRAVRQGRKLSGEATSHPSAVICRRR